MATNHHLTPWMSISASVIPLEPRQMGYQEALASPCASCGTAPCCTHLPLHTFQITNLVELDHAVYLLNFDRIQLGLSASGEWSVYYAHPCRFLNRQDFTCTVHNTPTQPQICVQYNPYNCWYKRVFTKNVSQEFLMIDRERMDFVLQHLVLDENRQIVGVPEWASMVEAMAQMGNEPNSRASEPDIRDEALATWEAMLLQPNGAAAAPTPQSYEAIQDPCTGCAAYCCKTLVFPHGFPTTASNLDYYRFCLGFPGIEIGISDQGWSVIVKTTCRHLTEDNRCGVYGQASRPLICKYYDAWKCTYRVQFGLPRPENFLRVRLEQFPWLTECFPFDAQGNITAMPPTEVIRQHIESRWQEVAHLPVIQPV